MLLLIDYKLPDTVALYVGHSVLENSVCSLPRDRCELPLQQKLQSMNWEDLLTDKAGREVGKGLVTAVINQQISQQISVWPFYSVKSKV